MDRMKNISVLDTSLTSFNLGNEIIMDAVNNVIRELFEDSFLIRIQCMDKIGPLSLRYIQESNLSFIGGSNLLTSQMNKYKQIGFTPMSMLRSQDMILLGVGWWQYQRDPNMISRLFLRNLLSSNFTHSARDRYTLNMLRKAGITNVLNTSCPSTWSLTEKHCSLIPSNPASQVVFTLTDYNCMETSDEIFISLLLNKYQKIFFWPQGLNDLTYFKELNILDKDKIFILSPNLKVFDALLNANEIDYVGTRLHAGIRALQNRKRALILSIDNRAKEMADDINLNICNRDALDEIEYFINHSIQTSINLPEQAISKWKEQFKN